MKTYSAGMAVLAVLAVITMAGSAFAGQTQAEREMALRQRANLASTQEWQARVAMETGNLPSNDATQRKSEGVAKAVFPTVETGGTVYRIGIDTF